MVWFYDQLSTRRQQALEEKDQYRLIKNRRICSVCQAFGLKFICYFINRMLRLMPLLKSGMHWPMERLLNEQTCMYYFYEGLE